MSRTVGAVRTNKKWFGRAALTTTLAVGLMFAIAGASFGDNFQNNVTAGGSDTITAGGSTSITYTLVGNKAPNGDVNGCDVDSTHPATVDITVPSGASASSTSFQFTACGSGGAKTVTFSSSTAGTYAVSHSISGGQSGSLYQNQADWTLHVNSPVVTNHAPVLTVPSAGLSAEATSSAGAAVSFSGLSATDQEEGDLTSSISCTPASGSTFVVGSTKVDCSVSDSGGLSDSGFFNVTVTDTTAPALTLPSDLTAEATGPNGAVVTYSASATDLVDGATGVTCSPSSGSTFALGTTKVDCSATDSHSNTAQESFNVIVQDTTAPSISGMPSNIIKEATGPSGATASWTAPTASDAVDGAVNVICSPDSGSTFALGTTTVTCSATDAHGNPASQTFDVTVQDTTAPAISGMPSNQTAEATGPNGAAVSWTAPTANDLVDGAVSVFCLPASGGTFALGTTTVSCSATDVHNNSSVQTFDVTVRDTTPPAISGLPSDITATAASANGTVVSWTAPIATDLVDGSVIVSCSPASGSMFAPGATTVTCSATDVHGNTDSKTFKVMVGFNFIGFSQPVDNKILNGMKAGSTAPIKWQVSDGNGGYISDLSIVKSEASGTMVCTATTPVDTLEETATGGTQLRYDATTNQFVYNWQSPKQPGKCFNVRITLTDGSAHDAMFTLK